MKRILPIFLSLLMLCACSGTNEPVAEEPTPELTIEIEQTEIELETALSEAAELKTPEPTEEPSATPELSTEPTATPDGLLGGRFPDKFSDTPIKGERSYKSKSVSIEITRYETEGTYGGQVVYFVADIYLQDVTSIRAEAAQGDFSKSYTRLVEDIAKDAGAIIAINGDVYYRKEVDVVVRDGVTYRKRNENDKDLCVLYRDGRMETFRHGSYKTQQILESDPWQVWSFGPELMENGKARETFKDADYRLKYEHPRTALGYYEPGHYCWVVVDGRQPGYSDGVSLVNLAKLMQDLGCTVAYNMDGGGSSVLFWDGDIISKGCNESRTITDIVYILPEE